MNKVKQEEKKSSYAKATDDKQEKPEEEKVVEQAEEVGEVEVEESVKKEEFDALKSLASQLDNNYKRCLADYQNLQRRTQDEKASWIKLANKDLIMKMLSVLDTLLMASKHLNDQGLSLGIKQFLDVLKGEGVEQIPSTVGLKFDPNKMECITTVEGEDGKVVEQLRDGYLIGDIVLRTAQVIVGKAKAKN